MLLYNVVEDLDVFFNRPCQPNHFASILLLNLQLLEVTQHELLYDRLYLFDDLPNVVAVHLVPVSHVRSVDQVVILEVQVRRYQLNLVTDCVDFTGQLLLVADVTNRQQTALGQLVTFLQ